MGLFDLFKQASRPNLSKLEYWEAYNLYELMDLCHEAVDLLNEKSGGYSGRFDSVEEFRDAGMRVWMLTGDNGITAKEIGLSSGILDQSNLNESLISI